MTPGAAGYQTDTMIGLPAALSGERLEFQSRAGRLSYYVSGSGPPLLLVHSVNAAACAAEVRPLHERYRNGRTVFSLELPGYGFSERSDRPYTPRLMTDALLAMLEVIQARCGAGPIDALALSLSSEFLARAANEAPDRFRSLALVSPTGLAGRRSRRGPPGSTYRMDWLYWALRGPGWGAWLFRGLTRPSVIRYFLRRTWGSQDIDETLRQYDILTTRQPGAEYAPLAFLSGGLFSADIHTLYEGLRQPLWLSHGVRGDFTDYRYQEHFANRANWSFTQFETGALPQFERTAEFVAAYDAFLAREDSRR